jgi:UDP-glucose:glycoprotein glucosyltransferase
LPSVRRDIHNAIIPVDLTSEEDVSSIVETMQGMVKRLIPIRWGIVPRSTSPGAVEQAKVVYYLLETYGLSAVMKYLEAVSYSRTIGLLSLTQT